MTHDYTSYYMRHAWQPRKVTANARRLLADVDYDTLVGTGLSGALVVPHLARLLGKHALIVRKPEDGSHSWRPVEGKLGDRWVFVDDFIASGKTLDRVRQVIGELTDNYVEPSTYVGAYLYRDDESYDPEFIPA